MAKKFELNADVIKMYLFWSLTPIGLAAALFASMMAIGSIAEDMDKQKTQLETQKKSIESLRASAKSSPNEETIKAINEKTEELRANVFEAWKIMETPQDEFRWQWTKLADSAIRDIENTDFLGDLQFETLQSYSTFARDDINTLLDRANLRRVQQYRVLSGSEETPIDPPRLAEGRATTARGSSQGRASAGSQTPTADGQAIVRGKVVWERPDSLNFTTNQWDTPPESFEVWLTQEELEVYLALLWVVAKSNEESPEPSKRVTLSTSTAGSDSMGANPGLRGAGGDPLDLTGSVVKQILDISIGSPAGRQLESQSNRRVTSSGRATSSGSGSGSMGSSGSSMGSSGGSMGSSSGGTGGSSSGSRGRAPSRETTMAGRYVDASGKSLRNIDLSGQFRRMPVFLSLVVDQRRIPEILVNCANCPMPIDVLWFTMNPGATQNFAFSPSLATGASGSRQGGGASGARSRTGSSSSQMQGSGSGLYEFGSDAVTIDIYGCISIFSPPDPQKIGGKSSAPGPGSGLSR